LSQLTRLFSRFLAVVLLQFFISCGAPAANHAATFVIGTVGFFVLGAYCEGQYPHSRILSAPPVRIFVVGPGEAF
jgi:hypothetical protein